MSTLRRSRPAAAVVGALVVAIALAFFVAPRASGSPDGLNRVAIDEGFAAEETPHALGDAPTAGYAVEGIDDERLSTGVAGIIGVATTFAVAAGLLLLVRRRRPRAAAAATS
jgi:hypothetical protein